MKDILQISGLNKSYGDIKAVQDISFRVKEGELFAFLGVNGAGKSTTISIICGTLAKDSGEVIIDGESVGSVNVKRKIGVVFQNSVLDRFLSVADNLKSRAACYGICGKEFQTRLDELCETFDLKDILKRPVGKLSGGQRRRVDIARALISKPKILILDEPTTGLDPQTRKNIWEVLDRLRKTEGMTVFLTTHYMEEATDADYIVILDGGKIVAEGTPLDLKNRFTGDFITVYNVLESDVEKLGLKYEKVKDAFRIEVKDIETATRFIFENRDVFKDYEIVKGKMDDVFLAVTGKNLGGGDEK